MQELDMKDLEHMMDITKSEVFRRPRSAFFGSLACSMQYTWDESEPTAYTNFVEIGFNPHFYLSLEHETRVTVLMHELWHVALMHDLRKGTRNHDEWNQACDHYINLNLKKDGFSFKGIEFGLADPAFINMCEEEIYEELMKNPPPKKPKNQGGSFGKGGLDMKDTPDGNHHQVISAVIRAMQQAKIAGEAGAIPGNTESIINKFLDPVIKWEVELMKFFTDMLDEERSWKRPNRRFQDIYLPSKIDGDGRLEHLMYFLDVSGSITERDIIRFNSEVKYIKEELKPKKLTLVQFDTRISHVDVFEEDDPFEKIIVVGGGGTCLKCVRKYIEEHKPTAAVIFSDMEVAPMAKLTHDIPVIWVAVGSGGHRPTFGKVIHIRS